MKKYDVIVIGAGPAGISGAIYARRGGLSVLVLSHGGGDLEKAREIENYYGIKQISGGELLSAGIHQAEALGIEIKFEEVLKLGGFQPYIIETREAEYEAEAVIIATGRPRRKPKIKGIQELEGKGVSYCAVCDAFFFRGKAVAVLGAGDFALSEAEYLSGIVGGVVLLTNGEKIPEKLPENISSDGRKIKELSGEDSLENIIFEDDGKLEAAGLFIALGTAAGTDFAASLGIALEEGYIKIDRNGATNVPGIFAAGDITGGLLQISTAVGEGAAAGQAVIKRRRATRRAAGPNRSASHEISDM